MSTVDISTMPNDFNGLVADVQEVLTPLPR
jgi:hypothetical protein